MKFWVICILIISIPLLAAVKKQRFAIEEIPSSSAALEWSSSEVFEPETPQSKTLGEQFILLQKELREKISQKILSLKAHKKRDVFSFLLICFLYGMLHALGPGHGKSIVAGYFLARKGRVAQGLFLGASVTFAHTLSAVLLLFILYAIFKAAVFPHFEMGRMGIEIFSYILLIITGIILLGLGIKNVFTQKKEDAPVLTKASTKEILTVAFITGIVPCPAVALIVLFCLLHSMVFLALISSLVICLGMTFTNSLFGILAVVLRKGVVRGSSFMVNAHFVHSALSITGGVLIFISGVFLLLSR